MCTVFCFRIYEMFISFYTISGVGKYTISLEELEQVSFPNNGESIL